MRKKEPLKIIEFTPERMRQMQLLQLDILKEFDRICRKHGLKYTLCGGSMLGAVRHKGFIPWDDDIDVTMLRDEYERFCAICRTELNQEKYFLQTMDTDPEYRLVYGRILLNGTAFVRAGQEHMKSRNGIFIDIFPRDGLSDIFVVRMIQRWMALLLRKTLYSPVGVLRSPKRINRIAFWFLSKLPRSFAINLLSVIQALNFGKETELVECYGLMEDKENKKQELGPKGYRAYKQELKKESKKEKEERKERSKGFKRIYFEQLMEMPFEDMNAKVSVYYDTWLKGNYDDYMKLPPKHKRVMHQTVSYCRMGEFDEN